MNDGVCPSRRIPAPVSGRSAVVLLVFVLLLLAAVPAARAAGEQASTLGAADLGRLLKEGGVTVLNTMSRLECMDGRIPGSRCIASGDPAAHLQRLAPDRSRPLVLYCAYEGCPQAGTYLEAARTLGYAKVSVLKGGFAAWKEAGYAAEFPGRTPREPRPAVRAAALERWLAEKRPLTVLDIRTPGQYREGHIEGAISVPLEDLHERYQEIPLDNPLLVVVDERGDRSFLAASYLERKGFEAVRLYGGMRHWKAFLERKTKAPAGKR